MSPESYILAIDLGTGGPKTGVVALDGSIVSTGKASVQTVFTEDHGVEQDPTAVWDAVKSACKQALDAFPHDRASIKGVICASQYSSVVPVDDKGHPTMNMVVWMDERGAPARLKQQNGQRNFNDNLWRQYRWLRIHGIPPLPSGNDNLAHMRWVKAARPEVYARTRAFLEPMDYVTARFTGRITANQCTAFMFLLTDNNTLNVTKYDDHLLKWSGIEREKLPELVPVDAVVGNVLPEVAEELGLDPNTQVITGLNDTQSGGVGCYAFKGDHAAICVGTTSVMITHVDFKRTDPRTSIFSMPSPVPNTYFVGAENGIGGRALEHFLESLVFAQDALGDHSAEEQFEALDRAVNAVEPGSNGVIFLPWLNGAMAPAADANMRGGFLNLSLKTSRQHMARAVLEGVAFNFRWLRQEVEKFSKRDISSFLYYGGGAMSDTWSQIMADVFQAPVHQVDNPRYANCRGAGMLAFQRLGMLQFDDFEARVPIHQTFEPNPQNALVYDKMFEQFRKIYKKNRPIFRALNKLETGKRE